MKLVLALVAPVLAGTALAAPAAALAQGPTMVVRDVPLSAASAPGARTLAAAAPRFNLVAAHWRGTGAVFYRTRGDSGRWSAWRRFDADRVQQGWHIGDLDWTGGSTAIRFRTTGTVSRVRAYYVDSPTEPIASRRLQTAGSPLIISRFSWQADESIRRAAPKYADAVHFAVVHHTAGSNNYTREQSAAIVRGIEIYHVKGNGWNDIGYNFLVDKYGQIFEGRYGGVDKAVIGAHSLGFNTGSVGVAVIGDYNTARPTAAAANALEQLLAWKLDLSHVDPLSTLTVTSGGNPRFGSGLPVFLRAISGHRDTNFTDCPGNALYALLPAVAKAAAAIGGPKIYAPLATQRGEGQVRFTARLSTPQPWTVTILDSAGAQVAQGAGTGTSVDWTWDGSAAPPDRYTWTIESGSARPATGALGTRAVLALQKVAAQPSAVAPTETTTVTYTLTAPATVTATLASSTGATLATLLTAAKPAGVQTLSFTPPPGLASGRYTILVAAISGPRSVTATIPFTVDDILGGLSASSLGATLSLTRAPQAVSLQVLQGTAVAAAPSVAAAPGSQTVTWPALPDGAYTVALTITDEVGTYTRSVPLVVDTTAPRVAVLSYRGLRFRVSEPATLLLTVGTQSYRRVLPRAATTQFWLKTKPAAYVLTATDAAGNVTTVRYPA